MANKQTAIDLFLTICQANHDHFTITNLVAVPDPNRDDNDVTFQIVSYPKFQQFLLRTLPANTRQLIDLYQQLANLYGNDITFNDAADHFGEQNGVLALGGDVK